MGHNSALAIDAESGGEALLTAQTWFGDTVIASHTDTAPKIGHYAELMERRFAGLRITITPADPAATTDPPLPPKALWGYRPPL